MPSYYELEASVIKNTLHRIPILGLSQVASDYDDNTERIQDLECLVLYVFNRLVSDRFSHMDGYSAKAMIDELPNDDEDVNSAFRSNGGELGEGHTTEHIEGHYGAILHDTIRNRCTKIILSQIQ